MKKRIAIISISSQPNVWNGQGRSTFSTASILIEMGHDVSVFTYTKEKETFKELEGQVSVFYIGGVLDPVKHAGRVTSLPFDCISIWNEKLLPLLMCEKFDVLILNNWQGYNSAKIYAEQMGVKLVGLVPFLYSFSGWLQPLDGSMEMDIKRMESDFLLGCDTLVTHTCKFGNKLANYINRDVVVIPNCYHQLEKIPTAKYKPIGNQICFVGRVNREKSLERIIRVLPDVKDAQLIVASPESPTNNYILKMMGVAKELDVEHRVKFIGWLPAFKVVELYLQSSLTIVPSQFEPYGYPALDPMSLGVPVLVSEWSSLSEYLGSMDMVFSSIATLADRTKAILQDSRVALPHVLANKARINSELSSNYMGEMLATII